MKLFNLTSALLLAVSASVVRADMRIKLDTEGNSVGILKGQVAEFVTSRNGNFIEILTFSRQDDSEKKVIAKKSIKGFREEYASLTATPGNLQPGYIGSYVEQEATDGVPGSGRRVDLFLARAQ
jgi:hypothetical protein